MTRKNRRRCARWIVRYLPRCVLRSGRDTAWMFWELQTRMHNERRIFLPPPEDE